MSRLQTAFAEVLGLWKAISPGRRLLVVGVTVIALIAVGAIAVLGGTPHLSPLMSNLSPEDVQAITARLSSAQVPYTLADNGTAILVPDDRVMEQRLALASDGLPRGGGVGFELFDETKLGRTRFEERLSYQRALEGELRRTIRQINGVRDARVHLGLPERSLFRERDDKPRASVTLQLAPGRRLSEENVQAIVHLTASSVEGLAADAVTVVDTSGQVLASGDGKHQQSGRQLEHQRGIEAELERRATSMLERTVGPGGASVHVSAELDYSTAETTSETYDPDGVVLRSEQTSDETRAAGTAGAGGIPGSRSNLAGTQSGSDQVPAAGALGGAANARHSQTRNYEVSKTVSHEVSASGKLVRLSVAVLVDAKREKNDKGELATTPRSREELDRFAELVKSAVGFDGRRGDRIEVQSSAFVEPLADAEPDAPRIAEVASRFVRPGAAIIVAALSLVALSMLAKRSRAIDGAARAEIIRAPISVRELEAQLAQPAAALDGSANTSSLGNGVNVAALAAAQANNARAGRGNQASTVIKGWLNES